MEIIERIKKLHALAERNSSTAEAAAAAEKIQDLCFKYNLELSQVLGTPDKEPHPYLKHEYVMTGVSRLTLHWHRVLWHGLVKTNFCFSFYTPNTTKHTVIGQKHNFDVIVYQYEYLVREIERLGRESLSKQGFIGGKLKGQYFREFCIGAAAEIQRILFNKNAERQRSTEESKALVVVKGGELEKAKKDLLPNMKFTSGRRGSSSHRTTGGADGRAAAHNIPLNRGIGGSSRTLIG